ncbi:MAG: glycosyltransferase, partial [Deltaproteobacteria bacterium]
VFAPCDDTIVRTRRYVPNARYLKRPHPEWLTPPSMPFVPHSPGKPLRVAVIGALGPHKGSKLLLQCAKDALARALPLNFCLVGYSGVDELATTPNVQVTGAYEDGEVFSLLAKLRCQAALFLSVWPETFSYTLSLAFAAKLYPVAFDIGALGERRRDARWGLLLPVSSMQDPKSINDSLVDLKTRPPPARNLAPDRAALYPGGVAAYYDMAAAQPLRKVSSG